MDVLASPAVLRVIHLTACPLLSGWRDVIRREVRQTRVGHNQWVKIVEGPRLELGSTIGAWNDPAFARQFPNLGDSLETFEIRVHGFAAENLPGIAG